MNVRSMEEFEVIFDGKVNLSNSKGCQNPTLLNLDS